MDKKKAEIASMFRVVEILNVCVCARARLCFLVWQGDKKKSISISLRGGVTCCDRYGGRRRRRAGGAVAAVTIRISRDQLRCPTLMGVAMGRHLY